MSDYALNAKISYRRNLTDDQIIIRVSPLSGTLPPFECGQYAELAYPEQAEATADETLSKPKRVIRRSYSIASAPSEQGYYEFYLVLVLEGILTPKLFQLQEEDSLWLGPKIKGKFTLGDLPPDKDFVMVSTGTGIAPFVSMLREFRDKNRWRRFIMIHGTRYERDLGYREELEEIAKNDSRFIYIPTVTREPEDSRWSGLRGRVGQILEPQRYKELVGAELDPNQCHVMLCGNPEMIDQVQALLESQNFRAHSKKNPGNLHFERYW